MATRVLTTITGFSAFLLLGGALGAGCAQSSDPIEDDGDPSSTTSNTTTGTTTTGGGGMTGAGGAGGGVAGPCDIDCSAIATPQCLRSVCNDGSYPGAVGECVVIDDDDGTACDDGAFCTVDDTCQAGTCTGGPANDCGMTAPECQEVTCDEDTNSCAFASLGDGDPCTSGDLCNTGETCSAGVCGGGTPKDCFFDPVPNECFASICNPSNGMCEPVPANDGATCTDENDACQVDGVCNAGTCTNTSLKDCSSLDLGCDVGVCNSANAGQCEAMTVMQGQTCSDGDACTTGEVCDAAGACGGGSAVTTCSSTLDGCCPSNCDETNDADCACPGSLIGTTCYYVPDAANQVTSEAAAQAACQALGTGWDLCAPAAACDQAVYQYLGGAAGCDCGVGSAACACGSLNNNIYIFLSGSNDPHYIRDSVIPNCGANTACTTSVTESCGVPLCCK